MPSEKESSEYLEIVKDIATGKTDIRLAMNLVLKGVIKLNRDNEDLRQDLDKCVAELSDMIECFESHINPVWNEKTLLGDEVRTRIMFGKKALTSLKTREVING